MPKELSNEKKALANLVERINDNEIVNEEMGVLSLRIHKVYSDAIKNYFGSKAVVQFNFLEFLKGFSKNVKSPNDFEKIVADIIEQFKAKETLTWIEQNEYAMAKKVYRDVCLGKGKEFEYGKELKADYDDQEIRFAGFFNPNVEQK